jgi:beta-lactamase class A
VTVCSTGAAQIRTENRAGRRIVAIAFYVLYATTLLDPSPAISQPASSSPPSGLDLCLVPDSIGEALRKIARRVGGEIGVTAIHLESGARISYNGRRRFPMASVSKIPMALEFLRRVDVGEVDLSEELVVPTTDFRPGYSPLASWSGGRAERATVDSLFRLMIEVSDNTATDVILRMAGGPAEVTRRLRQLGLHEIEVNRSEARTFADLSGIPDTVPEAELYRYNYFRMRDALPPEHRQQARLRFGDDPRDTATPDDAAELLALIHAGEGLSPESRDYLLNSMLASRSGPRRIKGLLPGGTPVAHKTGTIAAAINDIGIITLPDGAGHVAIAVFVYTFHRTEWRRERTIAEVARLAYDYFSTATDPRHFGPVSTACGTQRKAADPRDADPTLSGEDASM